MENMQLLEFAKQLNEMIDTAVTKALSKRDKDPYQSEQTHELITAMAKAMAEYPVIGKNRTNPFFKSDYADFNSIMAAVRPALSKHGLVLIQYTSIDQESGARTLHSSIMHSSGQWMETRERITPEANNDQKWASTITYKKRHQAMAILNITIDDDASDDDAEENMKDTRVQQLQGKAINYAYSNAEQSYETINAHEHAQLTQALQGYPDLCKSILSTYKISALSDLPRGKYAHVINQVRKHIDIREKGTTPESK